MSIQKLKYAAEALRSYGADGLADAVEEACLYDEAKELELFAAWASTDIWLKYKDPVFFQESGLFEDPDMHQAWIVWKACAKSRISR